MVKKAGGRKKMNTQTELVRDYQQQIDRMKRLVDALEAERLVWKRAAAEYKRQAESFMEALRAK